MATDTTLSRRIHRSGTRMIVLLRFAIAVLVAAPFVALAVMGVDDWRHVGPDAIAGVATSTHCRYDDLGETIACSGDFVSDDGTVVLRDVAVRLEPDLGHTGPATTAPSDRSWVASGAGRWRVVPLLLGQAANASVVWIVAYGVTIMGLMYLVVVWTARQVGRTIASVEQGPELKAALVALATRAGAAASRGEALGSNQAPTR